MHAFCYLCGDIFGQHRKLQFPALTLTQFVSFLHPRLSYPCSCVYQRPDAEGRIGVALSKDIVKVASAALTVNMTRLGPLVLPLREKLRFVLNAAQRRVLGPKSVPKYTPDFKKVGLKPIKHT